MPQSDIAIVIPSLNPGPELPNLVGALRRRLDNRLIVVNDGSSAAYDDIFAELATIPSVSVLRHDCNRGKGRALKSAFQDYLLHSPNGKGVVIADADGQHLPDDIVAMVQRLESMTIPGLLLGVRDFTQVGVPGKSRIGNGISTLVLFVMTGRWCSDTQTGLRGIPGTLLPAMVELHGERFEYETAMLLECHRQKIPFAETTITTVYQNENRSSHFHPVRDSWRIYQTFFYSFAAQFCLFAGNGLLSALLDVSCFALLYYRLLSGIAEGHLLASVLIARAISLGFNYLVNKKIVFRAPRPQRDIPLYKGSFARYLMLCALIAILSYLLTKGGHALLPATDIVWVKVVVDGMLFLLSFFLQKCWCFASGRG